MTQTEEQEIESHSGYDLEAGLLQRVREWTDLFPWWRLTRTLRIAASPTMMAMTAATLFIWLLGLRQTELFADAKLDSIPTLFVAETPIFGFVWTVFLWGPPAILMTRQGGLLAAGRNMTGLRMGLKLALQRSWRGWFASVIPLAGCFAIALPLLPLGWLARVAPGQAILEIPAGLLSALIAIPSGVIAFGGVIAIPLSWAALGNEQDSDPLNALSRGYEALFRRPLHLTFYVCIAALIIWVIHGLAGGVGFAATRVAEYYLVISGGSPTLLAFTVSALEMVPVVVATTLSWGLVGGVYLLLRYDTGSQEVEDLWEQETAAGASLPELPTT